MAKTTGPLMSLDASGSIASTLTYSKWKGRNYVRQLVKPSNPKSPMQVSFRAMFGFLATVWKTLTPTEQGSWDALAATLNASPFNAFSQSNQKRWTQTLTPWSFNGDDSALAASVVTGYTATGRVREIQLTLTLAAAADQWGVIVYRNATTGFVPTQADVIAVFADPGGNVQSYVDSGLTPGTYFYRVATFSKTTDYVLNGTEHTATAT